MRYDHGIKRAVISGGFTLFLIFWLMNPAGGGAAPGKRAAVKFNQESWDFGKIKQGEILTYEFVFKNDGDAALKVEKVETSCGCAAALVSSKSLEPGQEGRIKVTFDSRGYAGKVVKYIFFESNDPDSPRKELKISADIEVPPQPRIELDRYNIDLGLSLEGEDAGGKFVVKNVGELELKMELSHQDITFFAGGKRVQGPLKLAAGKSVEVEFKFPAQSRAGMLRDYILLRSNDPVRSTLSLYVSRYVVTQKELKELFQKYKGVLEEKK
jgi:hypothetical protein